MLPLHFWGGVHPTLGFGSKTRISSECLGYGAGVGLFLVLDHLCVWQSSFSSPFLLWQLQWDDILMTFDEHDDRDGGVYMTCTYTTNISPGVIAEWMWS